MVLRELALFAGVGGTMCGALLGWRTVCIVEKEPYCQKVLRQRMRDNVLHDCPIWDDCYTFDGKPWNGSVDVITAGFPCQPLSNAGKRKASNDSRDGWPHTARIIREVQPSYVLLENVSSILTAEKGAYFKRLLDQVAEMGYYASWCVLGASDVGAPHRRNRWWCLLTRSDVANSNSQWEQQSQRYLSQSGGRVVNSGEEQGIRTGFRSWPIEPDVDRMANRVANRNDKIRALGNGQVPRVAATAWILLGGPTTSIKG